MIESDNFEKSTSDNFERSIINTLVDAVLQVLDNYQNYQNCFCCKKSNAELRIAIEPFLINIAYDDRPLFSLEKAKKVLEMYK